MSWKQKVLGLAKLYGPAAKFAAKAILGVILPGSPAVVELVGQALGCAHETAREKWEFNELKQPVASEADLRRLEEVLGVLSGDLSVLMAQVAALEATPDVARQVLNTALATDDRVQSALHKLTALAMRFDRLEEQNRRLLEGQGYAAGMLEELLPLVRRLAGVADFVTELRAQGAGPVALRSALGVMQAAAAALVQGRVEEASAQAQAVAGRLPDLASAQVARAATLAVSQDLHGAEACLTNAARLRPQDQGLADLRRRVTRATALETPRGAAAPGRAPRVGEVLDGWTLAALLGQGGWGQVFRAAKGERRGALKVMRPELSGDPAFAERFRREILTLAGLRGLSRNLVEIHDFGYAVSHGCWYFIMEYVEGKSLEHYLARKGPLTLKQALGVFLAVAKGLGVAHERGVVHRDIKPANILLRRDGKPVLVDFGLAVQESGVRLTGTGEAAGYTAMFAAPEQLRGKSADARSDVYSLAGSMYYALTYDRPECREPEHFEPEQAPEAMREALAQALERRPELRPATVVEFARMLKERLGGDKGRQFIPADPTTARSYAERGDKYLRQGDCDRAIADFDEAIRLDPKYAWAYSQRGTAYLLEEEYDQAIADLDEAIRLKPDARAHFRRGNAYIDKGDDDRAIADFDEVLRIDPGGRDHLVYFLRGESYLWKGDHDRAIADFDEVIRLDPKDSDGYGRRGKSYRLKGEYDRAIADFDEAIRLNPKDAWAYGQRGTAYWQKKGHDQAIADFDEAIRLDPRRARLYASRGTAYRDKGDCDRAIADLDRAIRLDPKDAWAYSQRGTAYLQKEKYDRAIADLDEAIRLGPPQARDYLSRGLAYRLNGQYDQAIADQMEALRLDPALDSASAELERARRRGQP
jgi:tetratricopeptide (TPR) repeat protein